MNDVKNKIRRLLALAQSPSEHEARAALLNARQLMAEHKLSESDCMETESHAVKHVSTGFTFSKRRDPWMCDLSTIIGESYCCQAYRRKEYRKQTCEICFVGLEEDVDICTEVFRYALNCITCGCVRLSKQQVNGYARGFTDGIRAAFSRQQEEKRQEWELVLAVPKEVAEATSGMKREVFATRERINQQSYSDGYQDGRKFDPKHRIGKNI